MKIQIDAQPVLTEWKKVGIFGKIGLDDAIEAIDKIDGLLVLSDIAQQDNKYLLLIAGNIGNREILINRALNENGCVAFMFIDDEEAKMFIENEDIYLM